MDLSKSAARLISQLNIDIHKLNMLTQIIASEKDAAYERGYKDGLLKDAGQEIAFKQHLTYPGKENKLRDCLNTFPYAADMEKAYKLNTEVQKL